MENEIRNGLEHGFIDSSISASDNYSPQFVTNNPSRGEKVITTIKNEMRSCDEFMFSVAFITYDGISALLNEFKFLQENGVKGKILASQYNNFTDPKALMKLKSLENVEVRIVTEESMKMHSKCYIFSKNGYYDIIIGSSNLTNNALCSNGEWNLKINSMSSGEVTKALLDEFNHAFEYATPVTDVWIEEYSLIYDQVRDYRRAVSKPNGPVPIPDSQPRIEPNKMQSEALKNIQNLRREGKDRALVISATGSGKTYLSAFDAKIFSGKYLYLVHRKPILSKSMSSFRKVLGPTYSIEQYDPKLNNLDVDCLFCTVQTMSKNEVLEQIPSDHFDYILIDEVHHAGADSYQAIINHFRPKFLMGMTATPDRSDGYDIYGLFDHNIAYEIRLKQAMEYKLVCPFHYFGITELKIDDVDYDNLNDFTKVELERRVDHIIQNAEFYGYSGDRVKGLVFCSRINEAMTLSALFNARGYRTEWVSGKMDKDYIETTIERLEEDSGEYCLDYIFVADLFNEGVDIPPINQVIMLRPTESPIVYIQQLGRGLRLYPEKKFVTVLDFIGNYENNYNIPIALSDDHSYNKSEVRRFVASGDSIIAGNSTISFDEISKAKIYESIDKSKFNRSDFLVKGYRDLKAKLGRIPKLTEFRQHGTIDALNLLSYYKSYHTFLSKKEPDYKVAFSDEQVRMLEYITKIAAPGKRGLEIDSIRIINAGTENYLERMRSIHPDLDEIAAENIVAVFDGSFYKGSPCLIRDNRSSQDYLNMIGDENFRVAVEDILDLALQNNEQYSEPYEKTNFVLNRMYTYDDVCRFLNWSGNINAQNIGGYKYDERTNTFVVFINYVKGEDVVESQRYEDHFENRNSLIALSKSTEGKGSKNMNRVKDHVQNGMPIYLFVRKNKDDEGSKEFYFLGEMDFVTFIDDDSPKTGRAVKIRYRLKDEVRSDLFDYFNS